jgi:metallo-beta-lactamase superfamily protein
MVDCGLDWLDQIGSISPTAIVLTHAHPDHAAGLAGGGTMSSLRHEGNLGTTWPTSHFRSTRTDARQARHYRALEGQGISGRAFSPCTGSGLAHLRRWKLLGVRSRRRRDSRSAALTSGDRTLHRRWLNCPTVNGSAKAWHHGWSCSDHSPAGLVQRSRSPARHLHAFGLPDRAG